ncbi:MAG: 2-amino-4-hydroxy-6-hydroxymethyldihydropteridine diphosphokinase [Acidobacteria bacterium]|nr:2-amino-4-hydroxy-6-hydroxymethyldihydropteridine diphosphokinase [Acidobacteriota bacterium]
MGLVAVAIALGSTLGPRRAHLAHAVARLQLILSNFSISDFVETEPVGVGEQPLYLNAVAVGTTELSPRVLLEALLAIEEERERARPVPGAARTLDLDLVLYGDQVIVEPGLEVPHPRFRDRFFVLGPLAEVAPRMIDPVTGLTVAELLKRALA